MLIPFNKIVDILSTNDIRITGAFHVGAHDCEEMHFYNNFLKIEDKAVIWIDALPFKVDEAKAKGIPNIFHALISDEDNSIVEFNVSNNFQSSSILDFKTHAIEHPHVVYTHTLTQTTTTVDTFFEVNNLPCAMYNFWNFDIQGAELMALKGAEKSIGYADALYLEVNEKELYKGCGLIGEIDSFLEPKGFKRVLTEMTGYGWGDALYIRKTV